MKCIIFFWYNIYEGLGQPSPFCWGSKSKGVQVKRTEKYKLGAVHSGLCESLISRGFKSVQLR